MKKLIIIIPRRKSLIWVGALALLVPTLLLAVPFITNVLCKAVIPTSNPSSRNELDLLKAYEENDTEKTRLYFENWNEESKKLTKTEYKDELEESLYKIFREVYHPYNLDPLVREPMMDYYEQDLIEVINRTPYLVIQNQIQYIIHDLEPTGGDDLIDFIVASRIERDDIKTLENFYPEVDEDIEKVLHLTKKHEEELTLFLGSEDQSFGEKHIMGPSVPKGETGKRYEFLRNYIPILYGHWGGYWHLSTHPELGLVFINPELNHALAQYRIGYNFGYAELRKVKDNWIFIRANMNGME